MSRWFEPNWGYVIHTDEEIRDALNEYSELETGAGDRWWSQMHRIVYINERQQRDFVDVTRNTALNLLGW
jgi:hypothetical protein